MTTIWFVAALSLIVDVRTDGRTFLPGLLGHLSGDDLKIHKIPMLTQHTHIHTFNGLFPVQPG